MVLQLRIPTAANRFLESFVSKYHFIFTTGRIWCENFVSNLGVRLKALSPTF